MNVKRLILIAGLIGLFMAGCGSVDEQQVERILSGVAQTTVAGVTIVPDNSIGSTLDVNLIVQQTFVAMTVQAGIGKPQSTLYLQPGLLSWVASPVN